MAYERRRSRKLTLKNARFIFRPHFTDAPDNFGNTSRYFNVVLEETEDNRYGYTNDMKPLKIEDLVNDGWNVKHREGTDEYEETYFIKVYVAYRNRDGSEKRRKPMIIKAVGGPQYKIKMDEDNIAELDEDFVENIDHIDINAYENPNRPGQITGYVQNMYVTVEDDPFLREYGSDLEDNAIEEDDEPPF